MIDWSASAAWIALIVAIVSPVLTTIITLHHQRKMYEKKMMSKRKLDTIEGYLRSASESAQTIGTSEDFAVYEALIFLYAPIELVPKIKLLNQSVKKTDHSEATLNLLQEVALALRSENTV